MKKQYDIIIVGTGAAGLFTALNLDKNLKILMVTKGRSDESDSYLAQGGICNLLNEEDYDSFFEDTMKAGHYKNNKKSVDVMIRSSNEIINDLVSYGVDFERDKNGNFSYTREGGHSKFRILHHDDLTGKEITSKLYNAVKKLENVNISEFTEMLDITEYNGKCTGVIVRNKDNEINSISSKAVIWATGGIGGLFKHSTNFALITADSVAIALNHNINIKDINYIQIHPTVLYSENNDRRFLISESVRGEGAILLNENKERFVNELLPRDVVCEAILEQMKKFNTKYVYLSVQNMTEAEIKNRFPNIYQKCLEEGYNITTDLIPVTPAQHYFMGGIETDTEARTSMKNLYAVGEAGCNGVHGANRLASNSLLEALVFSKRAALDINENIIKEEIIQHDNIDFNYYKDYTKLKNSYRKKVLDAIKERDEEFYDTWFRNEN